MTLMPGGTPVGTVQGTSPKEPTMPNPDRITGELRYQRAKLAKLLDAPATTPQHAAKVAGCHEAIARLEREAAQVTA
jgi:hypothetical protein